MIVFYSIVYIFIGHSIIVCFYRSISARHIFLSDNPLCLTPTKHCIYNLNARKFSASRNVCENHLWLMESNTNTQKLKTIPAIGLVWIFHFHFHAAISVKSVQLLSYIFLKLNGCHINWWERNSLSLLTYKHISHCYHSIYHSMHSFIIFTPSTLIHWIESSHMVRGIRLFDNWSKKQFVKQFQSKQFSQIQSNSTDSIVKKIYLPQFLTPLAYATNNIHVIFHRR